MREYEHMVAILLPVKPKYVNEIMKGNKKYEYRRIIAKNTPDSIYLYSTFPICKVVAVVTVKGILTDSPRRLWERTKRNAGIVKKEYDLYFSGVKRANAYILGDVYKLHAPIDIKALGIATPPQSFIYIDKIPSNIMSDSAMGELHNDSVIDRH